MAGSVMPIRHDVHWQRRREPIFEGKSCGRVSSRISTMRRSHLPPEHWMLQVTWPSAIHLAGRRVGICSSIVSLFAGRPPRMIPRPTTMRKLSIICGSGQCEATARRGWRTDRKIARRFQRRSSYTNRSRRCTSASRRLSSGTTASDMRTRLLESNNSSEISQLRSTLEMRFLATLAPSVFCSRRRESRCGAN